MKIMYSLCLLVGISACSSLPSIDLRPQSLFGDGENTAPQPASAKERLAQAIEGQGCHLSADNVATVLTESSLTAQDVRRLIPVLEQEQRVQVAGDGAIKLTSGGCA